MGIFSFGRKDDAPNRRGANSSSSRGNRPERVGTADPAHGACRATRMRCCSTPLCRKSSGRGRRLVGAIALVIAAVVILPMVLDSHPKPVTDDISIDIPSRPVSRSRVPDADDTQAGVAPDNPAVPDASLAASGLTAATPPASSTSRTSSASPIDSAPSAATVPANKQQSTAAAAANTSPAKPSAKTAAAPARPSTPETSSNVAPSGRRRRRASRFRHAGRPAR